LACGGRVGIVSGMVACWLLLFAVALPCALLLLPWNGKLEGFHRGKQK
jgi:hypothetical protein